MAGRLAERDDIVGTGAGGDDKHLAALQQAVQQAGVRLAAPVVRQNGHERFEIKRPVDVLDLCLHRPPMGHSAKGYLHVLAHTDRLIDHGQSRLLPMQKRQP